MDLHLLVAFEQISVFLLTCCFYFGYAAGCPALSDLVNAGGVVVACSGRLS